MDMKYVSGKAQRPVVPKSLAGNPVAVDYNKDMALHLGLHTDSNFVAANMKSADGRQFNFLLHQMTVNPEKDPKQYPLMLSIISFTDKTNRTYSAVENLYPAGQFKASTEKMDISCATSSISGTGDKMHMTADLPDGKGKLDINLDRFGPVLYAAGTGTFPFLNNELPCWRYALPYLKATGTLTYDGKTSAITGDAWLDRQWNDFTQDFFEKRTKWKWMDLNLDNGYRISVADILVDGKMENSCVEILSPKGALTLADMVPLEKKESDFWVSPVTKQRYPTKFVIEVPSLDIELTTKVYDGIPNQEIVSPSGDDKYEAAATFTGKFMGKKVSGFNYIELVGNFL
jgi:predicted secreted hydrolase